MCRMMRIFNRLHKAIGLLEYFSSQDWEWNSENMNMLMNQLSTEDRKVHQVHGFLIFIFPFHVILFASVVIYKLALFLRCLTLMCVSWIGLSTLRITASAPRSTYWTRTWPIFQLPDSTCASTRHTHAMHSVQAFSSYFSNNTHFFFFSPSFRLRNIRYTFNTVLLVFIWRVFIARSQMARNIWYFVVSLCFKFLSYFRASSTLTN